jgi:hypothetical protein
VMLALIVVTLVQVEFEGKAAFRPLVPAATIAGLAVSASVFPFAMRRMNRLPAGRMLAPSNMMRPMVDLRQTHLPELSRALLGLGPLAAGSIEIGIAAISLILLMTSLNWKAGHDAFVREAIALVLLYAPLMIAASNCSGASRRERQSGAIDRILLAERPWSVVLQLAAGLSIPFLAVSCVVGFTLVLLGWPRAIPLVAALPAAALLLAGVGLAEGLRNRPLGLYLVSAVIVLSIADDAHLVVLLAGLWIPWACALSALERPDGAAVSGALAVIAAAHLGLIAVALYSEGTLPFLAVAGLLSVAAGLFVPARHANHEWRRRAACAAAAGFGAGVAELIALSTRGGGYTVWTSWEPWFLGSDRLPEKLMVAALCAGYAAAGIMLGWLTHNLFGHSPGRSRTMRAVPLVAALLLPRFFAMATAGNTPQHIRSRPPYLLAEFAFLGIAVIAVAALMILERRRLKAGAPPVMYRGC